MFTIRSWALACVLFFQAILATAQVNVEFPDDYSTSPYENHYRFDRFDFHLANVFGVKNGAVIFPDRAPFIILQKFFETLVSSDAAACQTYFREWNADIENGLNALKKMPNLELVADWKQDGHWVVIMSKGGNRGKSMIPFVMKDDASQKFVTDARFLGDFIGLLGKFLVDRPNGILAVVNESPVPSSTVSSGSSIEVAGIAQTSTASFLIISSVVAVLVLLAIYAFKFRK